ncbi:hypothetical protein J3R83DRAFT_1359 [Lanmaoa asiatica]|nr:hypothetical protein J3R83DRAFT_1359 [Lanmaoa asiatica]
MMPYYLNGSTKVKQQQSTSPWLTVQRPLVKSRSAGTNDNRPTFNCTIVQEDNEQREALPGRLRIAGNDVTETGIVDEDIPSLQYHPIARTESCDEAKCQSIIDIIRNIHGAGIYETFQKINLHEYTYIMQRLDESEEDESLYSARLTYYPSDQDLVAFVPHDIHEAPLPHLNQQLKSAVQAIPFGSDDDALALEVLGNSSVLGDNIEATPDILMRLFYRCSASRRVFDRTCFVLECAFTQSNTEVHRKLSKYIADFPDLVAVSKIIIKETQCAAPRGQSLFAQKSQGTPVKDRPTWMSHFRTVKRMGPVIRDELTWINIIAIEMHMWVRTGNDSIDIDQQDTNNQVFAKGASLLIATILSNWHVFE